METTCLTCEHWEPGKEGVGVCHGQDVVQGFGLEGMFVHRLMTDSDSTCINWEACDVDRLEASVLGIPPSPLGDTP